MQLLKAHYETNGILFHKPAGIPCFMYWLTVCYLYVHSIWRNLIHTRQHRRAVDIAQ